MHSGLRFIIITAALSHRLTSAKLLVKPSNKEAKVGDQICLNCLTNITSKEIHWYHESKTVYADGSFFKSYSDRFKLEQYPDRGVYNLIILSVQPEDVGKYTCREDSGVGEQSSSHLIVFDSDPVCEPTRAQRLFIGPRNCSQDLDEIRFSCSVTYYGDVIPQMKWRKSGESQFIADAVISEKYLKTVVSTFTLKVNLSVDNSSYICETEWFKCKTGEITLLQMSVENKTSKDELVCSPRIDQSCKYRWKKSYPNGNRFVTNDSTMIPDNPGTYQCEAECRIKNQSCIYLVMLAEVYFVGDWTLSPVPLHWVKLLSLLVLIPAGVGLIIFVVCIVKKRRNKQKLFNQQKKSEGIEMSEASQSLISSPKPENENSVSEIEGKAILPQRNVVLDESKPDISGLAVLGKKVFVLRKRSSTIEEYDSETFDLKRNYEVPGLTEPEDIASCHVNKCLYAFDWEYDRKVENIIKWEPRSGKTIRTWKTLEGGGHLTVADDTNIILHINGKEKLREYTPDGTLVRVINLASGTGITRSWHGVKLSSGFYVVCHGDNDNPTHRVCMCYLKEADGDHSHKFFDAVVTKTYDGKELNACGRLIQDAYLSVSKAGSILVSDYSKQRAVLLDSNLDNPQVLIREGEFCPWRTCADDDNDCWLVTDYKTIKAFQFKMEFVKQHLFR